MPPHTESIETRQTPSDVPPLTDSVWFWGCMFATAAVCALVLASSKYDFRQAQLENRYKARQEAGQTVSGDQGPIDASSHSETIITLKPLYVTSGILVIATWTGLFWQRSQLKKRMGSDET